MTDPIEHMDGSDSVTLRLARPPAKGTYEVTAKGSVKDSEGNRLVADTSRSFDWSPARPSLLYAILSPAGTEVTLQFTQRLDTRTVTTDNIRLGAGLAFSPGRPIIHQDGSSLVRVALAGPPPADGLYSITALPGIADTSGHTVEKEETIQLSWNPEPPVLERVTVSDDRIVTLEFSEPVDRTFSSHNILRNFGIDFYNAGSRTSRPGSATNITPDVITDTMRYRIPRLVEGMSYEVLVRNVKDSDSNRIGGPQRRSFTYDPSVVTFEHVTVSPDGRTLTLKFSDGLSALSVNRNTISLGQGLVMADENPISIERGSDTVTVALARPPPDGTHTVTAKRGILGATKNTPSYEQTREFWWNPESPRVESIVMAPNGLSVLITFSEEINHRFLLRSLIYTTGIPLDRTNPISQMEDTSTYYVNLRAPPTSGVHFVLVTDVRDTTGKGPATYYGRTFAWDAAPPLLVAAEMAADGLSVRLEFSEELDTGSVTAETISLGAGLSAAQSGHIEHVDVSRFVTVRLSSPPAAGEHTVTARAAIRDTTGIAMGTDKQAAFTYAPGAPAFESASISPDGTTVTLGFSEGLDTSTVSTESLQISSGDTALLVTQDTHGSEGILVDTTAPRLLDAFFTSARAIRLELSEPLDHDTVAAAAFALETGESTVPAIPSYVPGEAAVTLSLESDASSVTHKVSVKRALTDRAGNPAAESSLTITPQELTGAAPSFTAKRANGVMIIIEFSEKVRVKPGEELDWRDWLFASTVRPTNHYVDLDNRRLMLQFDMARPRIGFGEISYRPLSGSPALEDLAGYDLPVGSSASTATPRGDFPFFFAESTAEGVVNVRFDRTVSETPSAFRIGGTTAASEWTVNGAPATGVRAGATGEAASNIELTSAAGFYLTHSTPGAPETLQVKYTRPASGGNTLSNAAGALETMQVTSVNRIQNSFTGGAFADARTLELTSTRPADRRVADHLTVAATGDAPPVTLASGSRSTTNPLVETLRLGADARDGCTYRVSLTGALSSAMGIWTPDGGGQGEVTYTDAHAPVILSASTDGVTTTVLFNEPVSLGPSPTLAQHRGHWTVTDAGATREISAVTVSATDPSAVEIAHAALSGTAATPTVAYDGAADDDARVRDTRASPCTAADETPKNGQAGALEVTAADGAAPAGAVSASVSDGGVAKTGPNALWAGIGDTVTVSLAMAEDARGGAAPRLTASGENAAMAMGASAREWSGSRTVEAGAAEGDYAFTVTALDGGANLGVFTQAGARARAMVDTTVPRIASAETAGAGVVRVTLTEGAWGLLRASDWTVDGERAAGVSVAAGAAPSPAVALAGEGSFTLHLPGSGSTGATPLVVYSPQPPGASQDPAPDPAPAPPPAGIALDVGSLDGATVRMGESREFPIAATAADAQPIVLLDGNPGFVTVLNTGPGTATVTVDAAHESAVAGDYAFTVIAATGSDPIRMAVTVALEPAA